MTQFVTRQLRCPVCGTEFAVDELQGAVAAARETDFRPVHEGPDPVFSRLHACPGCRYCALPEGFARAERDEERDDDEPAPPEDPPGLPRPCPRVPSEEDVADLRRWARSGEMTRGVVPTGAEPFGAARYLVAGRIHEFLGADRPPGAAWYLLQAAWCARASRDRATERDALREAALRLEAVVEREPPGTPDRLRLAYLAGEAARRAGDFPRAADLLALAEKEADPEEEEGAFFRELAHRQGRLALVQSDVPARIPPEYLQGGRLRAVDADDDADDAGTDDAGED